MSEARSHPTEGLQFEECPGVRFFLPSSFNLEGSATAPDDYTFEGQVGCGTVHIECVDEAVAMPDGLMREVQNAAEHVHVV